MQLIIKSYLYLPIECSLVKLICGAGLPHAGTQLAQKRASRERAAAPAASEMALDMEVSL